ncbi:MAG: polysaccharide deacetylase family protein [Candidatus Omnitrophota bacterium]|jgi:peptidoglycan/xylan/chitin deacetylase (PgdA/CDA1 family)
MKKNLKKFIGFLLGNNLSFNFLRFINREKLLILYYHQVVKKMELANTDDINMYTDFDNFNKQMIFLKEHYRLISEKEVVTFMERGKFPDYSVWVTFDDGWKDNYTNAFPILKKYNIPVTFFVTAGYVNKTVIPDVVSENDIFMNWQEIKEVAECGISIGSHTISHRILSNLSDAELEKEIVGSKNEIEQRLGKSVISFAYPVGKKQHFSLDKCGSVLNKNNFKLAVTTVGGFNAIESKRDCFNLRRMGLSYEDTLNIFKFKISLGSFWQK